MAQDLTLKCSLCSMSVPLLEVDVHVCPRTPPVLREPPRSDVTPSSKSSWRAKVAALTSWDTTKSAGAASTLASHSEPHTPSPLPVPSQPAKLPAQPGALDENQLALGAVKEVLKALSKILVALKLPTICVDNKDYMFKLADLQLKQVDWKEDQVKIEQDGEGRFVKVTGAQADFKEFSWAYEKKKFPSVKDSGKGLGGVSGVDFIIALKGPRPVPSELNCCTIGSLDILTAHSKAGPVYNLILKAVTVVLRGQLEEALTQKLQKLS